MKFKVYLSSLTLLLATFLMVNAQTNSVTGKVTDGVDNLLGVNVIIQGTNTGVITNEDGVFTITSDLDLPWTLEVSSLGFSNQTLIVKSITQLISLSLVSGKELDEVVVSGSRKAEKISESSASITTVLLKEIENRPTFNAVTLLDNIVGVQVDKQGANLTNVTLRDNVDIFSTSALVMLDYRDITQIGMGFFWAESTNLSTIDLERVEVVRGPQAAIYGPGVDAGVIHYQSKDAFKYPGSTLQLQMGAISNGGSILNSGNFNMKSVFFRHAVSNDNQTFGYKFNLRYTENGEWDFSDSQKNSSIWINWH
jgi:iron complex outermembrane receptor protein